MSLLTKKISNPLDDLFNTLPMDMEEDGEYIPTTEGTLASLNSEEAPPEKDAEDIEIDEKIDTVYTAAIDAFNNQTAYMEVIEPRYAARNAEVAANYLNIALNAASVRAKVKGDRKKTAQFVPFTNNKTNGAVVASREDIMKMLAVDAEMKKG
jgi:hypothetical protein